MIRSKMKITKRQWKLWIKSNEIKIDNEFDNTKKDQLRWSTKKKTHHKLDMRYKNGRAVFWKNKKNKTKLPSNECVWHIKPLIHNGRAFKLPSRRHNHWESGWLKTAYATESQQQTPQQSLTDRQDPRRVTTVASKWRLNVKSKTHSEMTTRGS
jgi:hypothetical protein